MTPDDPYPDVRRLLDAVPPPEVRPVDVSAVYAAAAALQARRLRRWKRAAVAAGALAAGVFVFALLPRLEVRAGNGEFVVRWGQPPKGDLIPVEIVTLVPPDNAERLARLEAAVRLANAKAALLESRAKELDDLASAQRELKDLLLVVATEMKTLDEAQKGSGEQQRTLAAWVSAQLRDVDGKLSEVRKDQTAMYALVTDCRK